MTKLYTQIAFGVIFVNNMIVMLRIERRNETKENQLTKRIRHCNAIPREYIGKLFFNQGGKG